MADNWRPSSKGGKLWDFAVREAQKSQNNEIKAYGDAARWATNKANNSGCVVMLPLIGIGFASLVGLSIYLVG